MFLKAVRPGQLARVERFHWEEGKGMRIAIYTASVVGVLFVIWLGLIKLSETSPGPKLHRGKYIPPLAITLYVDNGQCKQKVEVPGGGVQDRNFPEIYVDQGVTWVASQDWSLSFQKATVLPPNTGTPFEDDASGAWQFNFSGTALNPTPSGPSVLTYWEKLFSEQVTFKYSAVTIDGTKCSDPSGMGVIVKPGG